MMLNVVIGSWGSYTNCNERALGSSWLDFTKFENWEDIKEELTKQGFELDGIDEELFIQDYENDFDLQFNCDYMHPATLFNIFKNSGCLNDEYKKDIAGAYIECQGFNYWAELVKEHGEEWDQDLYLHEDDDLYNFGRELYICQYGEPSDIIEWYFDFEAYANDYILNGNIHITKYGILEIY